jgi:hypothetical protein
VGEAKTGGIFESAAQGTVEANVSAPNDTYAKYGGRGQKDASGQESDGANI